MDVFLAISVFKFQKETPQYKRPFLTPKRLIISFIIKHLWILGIRQYLRSFNHFYFYYTHFSKLAAPNLSSFVALRNSAFVSIITRFLMKIKK